MHIEKDVAGCRPARPVHREVARARPERPVLVHCGRGHEDELARRPARFDHARPVRLHGAARPRRARRLPRDVQVNAGRTDQSQPLAERIEQLRLCGRQVAEIELARTPERNLGARRCRRRREQRHELLGRVRRRARVVDGEEVDTLTVRRLEREHQPEEVGVRLEVRAAQARRDPPDPRCPRSRHEQPDAIQLDRQHRAHLEHDAPRRDLLLMRRPVRLREPRMVLHEHALHLRDLRHDPLQLRDLPIGPAESCVHGSTTPYGN